LLGVRFAGEAPWPVVEVAAKYSDVLSVNQYQRSGDVNRALLDAFYAKSKKPILLSEYSFSAGENQSGDPNTKGANVLVPTQRERAEHATRFATQALALPYVVGLHWFEWADESPEGRFDGEDQNYGLVDLQDHPYPLLTEAEQQLNARALSVHGASTLPLPSEFHEAPGPSLHAPLTAREFPKNLPFFSAESRTHVAEWGDAGNGGSSHVDAGTGPLLIHFQSGAGWGAGVSLSPLAAPFDASGAGHLEAIMEFPLGTSAQIYLSEVGVGEPGLHHYDGALGSDGESYEFPALTGTGKTESYVVDLHELERRTSYGNQSGNQVLDLQALATVDLYIPGKQGSGEIRISAVNFTH